jgi:hypothetical protein
MTRDEFLTEKMGECWHKYREGSCMKCHATDGIFHNQQNNFSTWEGFGKLWTWAQIQGHWFDGFIPKHTDTKLVDPDRFANAIAAYLGYKP